MTTAIKRSHFWASNGMVHSANDHMTLDRAAGVAETFERMAEQTACAKIAAHCRSLHTEITAAIRAAEQGIAA